MRPTGVLPGHGRLSRESAIYYRPTVYIARPSRPGSSATEFYRDHLAVRNRPGTGRLYTRLHRERCFQQKKPRTCVLGFRTLPV